MTALYLRDATFVDWRTLEVQHGDFSVTDTVVRLDGDRSIPAGAKVVDCAERIVTRSFVVGHHHVYSALARGMPPPVPGPASFVEILERIWWNLDKQLDEAAVRASARVVGLEALRSGSTFVIDHHASPNAAGGSLHWIAEELDRIGVGHLLCYELSDRDGPERLARGLEETDRYLGTAGHQGLVGLHASFTVGDELLARAVELARSHDTGVHIHVAESPFDEEHCREQYGTSIVERLHRAGALDRPHTILAHCLHLDDAEREIVAGSRAWVAQNTESNWNNAVGVFDPRGLGDRVFLGTDGMHSDMLASARAAYLAGQEVGGLAPLEAYRRLRRVHDYLESNGFVGDDDGDLVVFDYPSPTPVTGENWPAHVMYGLTSRHVHTVIQGGRVVVDAGNVTTVDAQQILAGAREQAERLWSRL